VTFVNPTYTIEEFTCQLKDSGADYIVASPSCVSSATNAAAQANIPHKNIFLFGNEEIRGIRPYSSLISEKEMDPVEYSPEEVKSNTAYICYSSGTTGKNKGVETTHFNMVANLSQIYAYVDDIDDKAIFIGVWPIFHIYGLSIIVHFAIIKGASVVMIPDFRLPQFCKIIQDHKVSVLTIAPPMVSSLLRDPNTKQYDLSSLQLCIIAASPLSNALAEEFTKKFHVRINQGCGLTEASPVTHYVKTSNEIVTGSIGRPIPNIECKVVSKNGEELEYNKPGELYIRGPNVMKGYLNNQEATDACIDNEGWLRTGDLATVDNDGE
jgi:4-coumarate--CoA ligase